LGQSSQLDESVRGPCACLSEKNQIGLMADIFGSDCPEESAAIDAAHGRCVPANGLLL